MLTTTPHLRIQRPSPTTVEFTVSTAPPLTLARQILDPLTALLRLFLGLNVLFLLYTKYQLSPFATSLTAGPGPHAVVWHQLQRLVASRLGQWYAAQAARVPIPVLLPGALGALYALALSFRMTESLLVLRGLGVQTSSSSALLGGRPTTRFIPTEKIQDILINEAFYRFEVRYYLVVVVEAEEELTVVFPRLLPGLAIVEQVWEGSRTCLWEGAGKARLRDGNGGKEKDISL